MRSCHGVELLLIRHTYCQLAYLPIGMLIYISVVNNGMHSADRHNTPNRKIRNNKK